MIIDHQLITMITIRHHNDDQGDHQVVYVGVHARRGDRLQVFYREAFSVKTFLLRTVSLRNIPIETIFIEKISIANIFIENQHQMMKF